jgi:hypothetical protein
MRRRKVILGILALLACGVLAVVFWPEKEIPEPVYKGRKLSEWIRYAELHKMGAAEPHFQEALFAIGTNAIPFYVECMNFRPGLLKRTQLKLAAGTRRWLPFNWSPQNPEFARECAAGQLAQFGEVVAPAIPQLVSCVTNFTKEGLLNLRAANKAMEILANIGPASVPAVLCLMTNENATVRGEAIWGSRNCRDTSIIAQIRRATKDPNPGVRAVANTVADFDADIRQ